MDASHESKKVDKRTALALWDASLPPGAAKKKRGDTSHAEDAVNFTVITRKGNKQQTRDLPVPSTSALAVQTKTALLQDKAEQEQLKKLVLNYEQREEEGDEQSHLCHTTSLKLTFCSTAKPQSVETSSNWLSLKIFPCNLQRGFCPRFAMTAHRGPLSAEGHLLQIIRTV